jgi:hypothetical protein
VKNSGERTMFVSEKIHNLGCRPDNRPEFREYFQSIERYGKIIELAGPDIDDLRVFLMEKANFTVGKRGVPEGSPAFPGFLLGSFFHRPVPVYNHIMVVPDTIDLNPPVTRFHTGVNALVMMFQPLLFIYFRRSTQ